mgnify:CR=1 FL=1|tara:strand:- start:475 stop:966 length:492 start_codon:yes stop_codon:yes gene_type:complete
MLLTNVIGSPSSSTISKNLSIETISFVISYGTTHFWVSVTADMSLALIKRAILAACPTLDGFEHDVYLMSQHQLPIESTSQLMAAARHGAITLSTFETTATNTSMSEFTAQNLQTWARLLKQAPAIATFVRCVASQDESQNDYAKKFANAVLQASQEENDGNM